MNSISEGSKSSTHYLGDKNRFDVSSEGPSSGQRPFFRSESLKPVFVTCGHSWSIRGPSVVTRGHPWSLVAHYSCALSEQILEIR